MIRVLAYAGLSVLALVLVVCAVAYPIWRWRDR